MSLENRLKYAQMKARHKKILLPWYKKWWGVTAIIIGIIAFLFFFWASIYVVKRVGEILRGEDQTIIENQYSTYLQAIAGDGRNFSLGPKNSPITIVVFADFSCPFCRQAAEGLRNIANDYSDNVQIIFRDYPLHDNSIDLALAARCAGEQGHFWDMHDQFLIYKQETTATGAELYAMLTGLAEDMKLDIDRFDKCLDDRRYIPQIKKDFDDGELLEIAGTPTFFINNYPLTGYISEEKMRELINGLLKESLIKQDAE